MSRKHSILSLDPKGRKQASLSLSNGGLSLRSTAIHAPACHIASISAVKTYSSLKLAPLDSAVASFNSLVSEPLVFDSSVPAQ